MRIKEIILSRGLQQKDIAKALGIATNTFSQYVTGKRQPDLETLSMIADYLDVSVDFLLGRDEDAKKEPDATHGTELSSGEQALIQLFRRVPSDKRELVLAMIEAALQSGGLL